MALSATDLRLVTLKVIASEQVTVTTSGTAVNPSSNTDAVAVRVINNNAAKIAAVGMQDAQVDGSTTPIKGFVLRQNDARLLYVTDNASEVEIDADTNGTVVSVEIFGRE